MATRAFNKQVVTGADAAEVPKLGGRWLGRKGSAEVACCLVLLMLEIMATNKVMTCHCHFPLHAVFAACKQRSSALAPATHSPLL